MDEKGGVIEAEMPRARITHIGYLLDGGVPTKYWPQLQFSMWVCDVEAWDFMAYHPSLPPFIAHAESDPDYQAKLDQAIPEFLLNLKMAKKRLLDAGVVPKLEEKQ